MKILSLLLDIFLPESCCSCGSPISSNSGICLKCLNEIQFYDKNNKCNICLSELNNGICKFCNDRQIYFDKYLTFFEYSGVISDLFQALKFDSKPKLAKNIINFIDENNLIDLQGIDLVTFVPMNVTKKWKRGYNQSQLFAKEFSKKHKIRLLKTLIENKNSGIQREMSYSERFLNVIGRYKIYKKSRIKDKNILLIDDIFTSGATINECARILKKNGSKSVFIITIAKAKLKELDNN